MSKKFPVSFSRLSTFESCEAKFEHLYVLKSVIDQGNQYTTHGVRVHEALEHYGKGIISVLPDDLVVHKGMMDKILSKKGTKLFEFQMAIDANRTPCDWFSPDIWIRGVADILVVDGERAFCLDHKTGAVKENLTQLQLFAALVFAHYPEVTSVTTSYLWLAHGKITKAVFERDTLEQIWATLEPRFAAVQTATELGVFTPSPSRLCRWCPAKHVCGSAQR
jgi:hypothetical protein